MCKIALANLKVDDPEEKYFNQHHLGIAYLTSYLRKNRFDVKLIDPIFENLDPDDIFKQIVEYEPQIVGATATYVNIDVTLKFLERVKDWNNDVFTCIGGHQPTFTSEEILSKSKKIDCVVIGEGEYILDRIVNELSKNKWESRKSEIKGISFIDKEKMVKTDPEPFNTDLDALPFPARDPFGGRRNVYSMGVVSSRGCNGNCSFCETANFYRMQNTNAWRGRSAENVVAEISSLIDSYHPRFIVFEDDNFIGPPNPGIGRALEIGRLLRESEIDVKFQIQCRADSFRRKDELKELKEFGLETAIVGFESGCDSQLKRYNKGTSEEQNRVFVDWLKETDIGIIPGFIMFDPYVSFEELRQNALFLKDIGFMCDYSYVMFATKLFLYPGLKVGFEKQLEKDGLLLDKGEYGIHNYSFVDDRIARFSKEMDDLFLKIKKDDNHFLGIVFMFRALLFRLKVRGLLSKRLNIDQIKSNGELIIDEINRINYDSFLHYVELAEFGWNDKSFSTLEKDQRKKLKKQKDRLSLLYQELAEFEKISMY